MNITKNLLHNQNYVLGNNEKDKEQEKYICNKYSQMYLEEYGFEIIIYDILIFLLPVIIIYITRPFYILSFIFVFYLWGERKRFFNYIIIFIKKGIYNPFFIKIYYKRNNSNIMIIKNNIQYNTYLYKSK